MCNSPICQQCNYYNVSPENLVLDQIIILKHVKLILFLFSSLTWLTLY